MPHELSAAVRARVTGVVRSGFVDRSTAAQLHRRGIYMVPTLACLETIGDTLAFEALLERDITALSRVRFVMKGGVSIR